MCAGALLLHGCFQWSQLHSGSNAPWSGSARVIEDPVAKFGGTQVVLNIEGKRYLALAHAMAGRRLLSSEAGNVVYVEGVRASLPSNSTMRYAPRHIVGTFAIDFVGERIAPASPLRNMRRNITSAVFESDLSIASVKSHGNTLP